MPLIKPVVGKWITFFNVHHFSPPLVTDLEIITKSSVRVQNAPLEYGTKIGSERKNHGCSLAGDICSQKSSFFGFFQKVE